MGKKNMNGLRLTLMLGLAVIVVPAWAHHSFAAEYDNSKPVTLTGKLVKMDWVNPHSWIHVEVLDKETNKPVVWDVETGPPNTLYRNGWRKDSIKPGEEIVVTGSRAKDGTNVMNARSVKTPDGKTLLAGSSDTSAAPASAEPSGPGR
jgi:hypothetical protein